MSASASRQPSEQSQRFPPQYIQCHLSRKHADARPVAQQLPVHHVAAGSRISHAQGLKGHMDGARVFNAAEAPGLPVREIAAKADTVMFCLSKALCAPVGSMLAGNG